VHVLRNVQVSDGGGGDDEVMMQRKNEGPSSFPRYLGLSQTFSTSRVAELVGPDAESYQMRLQQWRLGRLCHP
jgi:hypothetical protein